MVLGISMASRGGLYLWHLVVVFICGLWLLYGMLWWLLSMASRGGIYLWSLASLWHLLVRLILYGISWWVLFVVFSISNASLGCFYLCHLVMVFICGLLHPYGISWWFCSMASRGGFHSWSLASLLHLVGVLIFGILWCLSVVVFCMSTASRGVFYLWQFMVAFTGGLWHLYLASGGVLPFFV